MHTHTKLSLLIGRCHFLTEEQRILLHTKVPHMTHFQRTSLARALHRAEEQLMQVFSDAAELLDAGFWENFTHYRESRLRQMYHDAECDSRAAEAPKLAATLHHIAECSPDA